MAFNLLLLPQETREAIYYQHLLDCKRQLSCMAVGYNQWPTPKLLPTSGYSDEQHSRVASEYTDPLEVENFMLAAPHTESPYRQSYGWSSEKLTNLMCVSRLIRQEAEAVLYHRFIFCFHYRLYPKAALRFLSDVSATALSNTRNLAFVLRFERYDRMSWTHWRVNSEVLSRHLKDVRSVVFEIQTLTKETTCRQHQPEVCPTKLKERDDTISQLLEVAGPFTARSGVQVRWVGVGTGRTLAELCRVELAKGENCPKRHKRPYARDCYLMAFDS